MISPKDEVSIVSDESVRCEENKAAQGEVPGMYINVHEEYRAEVQRRYPTQITLS